MKVILRQNFEPLGKAGAQVEVKDGYARNFLIPCGLVYPATAASDKLLAAEQIIREKRSRHNLKNAEELAQRLSQITVTTKRKAGEEGRLFGSVTSQDIAEELLAQGVEIDKRKVVLDEPIKLLGNYQVRVNLHEGLKALIQVAVLKADE